MINNKFIGVYENAMPPKFCEKLIEVFEQTTNNETSLQNFVEKNNTDITRNDLTIWLELVAPNLTGEFNDYLIRSLRQYADDYPILQQLDCASFNIKIQKTERGQGYHKWHCEQASYEVAYRMLVWTIYLNDVKEGGETEFLYQSERVKPTQGTLVFFPASWTHLHRGNPPLSNTKYIATGWYNFK